MNSQKISVQTLIEPLKLGEMTSISSELANHLENLLLSTHRVKIPDFWDPSISKHIFIPVPHGKIRVLHYCPEHPISIRPLVFVPGWGVIPSGFRDLFEVLYEKVEFYYIETREKKSSQMNRWKSQFTMSQKSQDIQIALKYLDLSETDFVLMGPCWGAAVIMQGLIDRSIQAPTIITVDPMHTLWFSKFVLKWIAPILPTWLFYLLRPIIRGCKLRNMHEPVQKQRAIDFINGAQLWKWKRAAYQVRNFELYGNLHRISQEIIVVNGTHDAIHDQSDYPKIAYQLPNARFLFLKTGEENRERLMGLVALFYSQVDASMKIPPELKPFEKKIIKK
ncbi:hypothetical protein [Candidatus Harpocratesius sp.]